MTVHVLLFLQLLFYDVIHNYAWLAQTIKQW